MIIDTPPIGIVTDALITYKIAHNPVYVMRSGISPKSFIENVDSFSKGSKLERMSIVLNGIEKSSGRYGYGYKSGYGYQYGYTSYGYGYGYLTKTHNSYYGEEVEDKRNVFQKMRAKLKKHDTTDGICRVHYSLPNDYNVVIIVGVFDGKSSTLVHELMHAVNFMLKSRDIDISTQSGNEIAAYTQEALFLKFHQHLEDPFSPKDSK